MVADHGFPNRPIALPDDDAISLAEARGQTHPAWYQPPRVTTQRPAPKGYRASAEAYWHAWERQYEHMSPKKKLFLVGTGILTILSFILFIVFHERIGQTNKAVFGWLVETAKKRRESSLGWLLPFLAIVVTSIPPLIGHGSCITFAGLMYGVWKGWLIAAAGNVVGAALCYYICRNYLQNYMERQIAKDKRLAAFSLVLKHDGLKLLCMIRLCPIPYTLMNGMISTFPSVTLLNHTLATAIVSPFLLIGCFIGSRLATLSQDGAEMQSRVKVINVFSIIFGMAIGITTGVVVYRKTKARAEQLEAEERETADYPLQSPSLSQYSDELGDDDFDEDARDPRS